MEHRRTRARATVALMAGAALPLSLLTATAAQADGGSPVEVVDLRVNGRVGTVLGIGDADPRVGWRMEADGACEDGDAAPCALDAQRAYRVQAASSAAALESGDLLWDSGRVDSSAQTDVALEAELDSRDPVAWRVKVWDALDAESAWSEPASFTVGLLDQDDWGDARWIEQAGRSEGDAMPLFARQFELGAGLVDATLYLSGVGLHDVTVNGDRITDELLAPGNSNYQLSSEYRTYDVTEALGDGANAIGVELGNGPAYVRRSVVNPAVGRTAPYSWWQSQPQAATTLAADAAAGATSVTLASATGFTLGRSIAVDSGDGGERMEQREITAVSGDTVSFAEPLGAAHAAGAAVQASGNAIAASDASAGAAVTPRFIGRLELRFDDGRTETIVTDRDWLTSSGPLVTDAWYSGSDYDARREQPGWNEPGADLGADATRRDGSPAVWSAAGIAPAPNTRTQLVARDGEPIVQRSCSTMGSPSRTQLVARDGEPIVEQDRWTPRTVTNPAPGTWVFDFGQNIVGWPELNLAAVPAGTTVRVSPAESLNPDGTVNQASLMGGGGSRGVDLFNTYTAWGSPSGERHHPKFNYFGMQWVQVTGLPEGYTPTADLVTGVRLQADTPSVGTFDSSSERIDRLQSMMHYSIAANVMSVFTDTPGREKLSYPADYTAPFGSIHRSVDVGAYLRTTMRHLVEAQSMADTPMRGNVALKAPVYDWGYSGRFGDEINWGNAIVLVPSMLYEYYGDTETMSTYYDRMVAFVDYIRRQKVGTGADEHIVDAALADWVSAEQTSGRITGTWGYYETVSRMATMAELTGHEEDAQEYGELAEAIAAKFHSAFFNPTIGAYTATGPASTDGATQAAQALALDAGLVPEEHRASVLRTLVDDIRSFQPNGGGPHFSAGTLGMGPVVRVLTEAGEEELLWEVVHQDTEPGYGHFLASTTENPNGMTTMGERWTRRDSKNHMILGQIDEWFQTGLLGIAAAEGALQYDRLRIAPRPAGDLTEVEGSFVTPRGTAATAWQRDEAGLDLRVTVPPATSAEVRVPTAGRQALLTPARATFERVEGDSAVYSVSAGDFSFSAPTFSYEDVLAVIDEVADAIGSDAADRLRALVEQALEASAAGDRDATIAALSAFVTEVRRLPAPPVSEVARAVGTPDEVRAALLDAGVRVLSALGAEAPGDTAVTPAAVVFDDRSGTDGDRFTVPSSEGVEYQRDGERIEAGGYPGEGEVTITARTLPGYVLAEGADAEWSAVFSTATTASGGSGGVGGGSGGDADGRQDGALGVTGFAGLGWAGLAALLLAAGVLLVLRRRSRGA